jgi:hypothetical protein
MLRRVTDLAAFGGEPGEISAIAPATLLARRKPQSHPFSEIRRRFGRSSACKSLVGLSWHFDPPATLQRDPDRLVPYAFDQKSLEA